MITLYQTGFLHLAIISGSRMAVLITLQGRFAKSLYNIHQIFIAGIEKSSPKLINDTPKYNLHYKIVFTKALRFLCLKYYKFSTISTSTECQLCFTNPDKYF